MQTKAAAGEGRQTNKPPTWVWWLAGWAVPLALAAALVYCWRVVFSLAALPAVPFTLLVAGLFSLLYLCVFLLWKFCKDQICLKAALCVFVLGLLFCFASAPLQAPDEAGHFMRSYAISMGRFNYDASRGYPRDVDLLYESFPAKYNHSLSYQPGWPMIPSAFADYNQKLASGQPAAVQLVEPATVGLLPYLPQALAIALARLFGCTALGCLYAARIANLAVYALLCWVTLRNCDKYRGVFMAAALLPLSLFMAASCSYDSLMLALCAQMLSFFCKSEIFTRDIVVFGLALACATYMKPNNLVLVAVLLLIPKARWKSKWNPWLCAGALLAAAVLVRVGMSNGVDGILLRRNYDISAIPRGGGEAADPVGQLRFMLTSPLAFLARAALTFYEEAGFLFRLGVFGWLDLSIPLVGGLSVLSLSASSALGIQQREDTKPGGALGLFLAALLYTGAVMAGIYFADSDLYSIRITGLQPRYFLPVILLLFMLASILLGKAVRPRLKPGTAPRTENITLWIAAGVAFVAVVLLFQNYFIGQWMPIAEGGFKMVNLLGWQVT